MNALWLAICLAITAGSARAEDRMEAVTLSVSRCWNVGSASLDTLRSQVVIEIPVSSDGTPRLDEMYIGATKGPTDDAVKSGFDIAARAVRRCFPKEFRATEGTTEISILFDFVTMRLRSVERLRLGVET